MSCSKWPPPSERLADIIENIISDLTFAFWIEAVLGCTTVAGDNDREGIDEAFFPDAPGVMRCAGPVADVEGAGRAVGTAYIQSKARVEWIC